MFPPQPVFSSTITLSTKKSRVNSCYDLTLYIKLKLKEVSLMHFPFFLHYPCAEANNSQTSYSISLSNMVRVPAHAPFRDQVEPERTALTQPQPLPISDATRHGVYSLTAEERLESFSNVTFHRATLTTIAGNEYIENKRDENGTKKRCDVFCVSWASTPNSQRSFRHSSPHPSQADSWFVTHLFV